MTTFREVCGGLRGMLAHQAAGEDPCGWCLHAEQVARLAAEALRPAPREAVGGWLPVTDEEASVHRAVLAAEVEEFEGSHPGEASSGAGRRHLKRVA